MIGTVILTVIGILFISFIIIVIRDIKRFKNKNLFDSDLFN